MACVVSATDWGRSFSVGEALSCCSWRWRWRLHSCRRLLSPVVAPQWWNPWCAATATPSSLAKRSFAIPTLVLHYPCGPVHLGNRGAAVAMDVKRRAHLLLLNSFLIAELCPASHENSVFLLLLLLLLVMLLLIVSHLLSFRLRSVGRRDLEVVVVVVVEEKKRAEEEGLCAVSGQTHHRFSNLRIPRSDLLIATSFRNFFSKQTSSFVSASWVVSLQVLGGGFQSVAKNANTNGGATTATPKLSVSLSLCLSLCSRRCIARALIIFISCKEIQ